MPNRSETLMLALAVFTVACNGEAALEPRTPGFPAAAVAVPRAGSFTVTVYPVDGWFADVNRANLIVGMANGRAIALPRGGSIKIMSSGSRITGKAVAVNNNGMIAGAVSPNCCAWVDLSPAVWPSYSATPVVLPDSGEAADVNDRGLVVGTVLRRGRARAFAWDVPTGSVVLLPTLPGGRVTTARAINNEQVILGTAEDAKGLTSTVLWRQGATGWTVQPVGGGIDGLDIDAWLGIVGATAARASYGKPDHAGWFTTQGASYAEAVSPNGTLAVGTDYGAATTWPQTNIGFVADKGGSITWLPFPANGGPWRASFGSGVTDCGLVVGKVYELGSVFTAEPAVWDPGC